MTGRSSNPVLLPNMQQLHSCLLPTITKHYNCNQDNEDEISDASKQELHSICMICVLYALAPNHSLFTNYFSILDHTLQSKLKIHMIPTLISLIVEYAVGNGISWDSSSETLCTDSGTDVSDQLSFSNQNSLVTFDDPETDFLNVISEQPIIGDHVCINCYVMGKDDEMWLGIINKSSYAVMDDIERRIGSMLYYGGRKKYQKPMIQYSGWNSGYGAIHGLKKVLKTYLPYYKTGDWISFVITNVAKSGEMSFQVFKNGQFISTIHELPVSAMDETANGDGNDDDQCLYFCGVVDEWGDGLLIEQVVYEPKTP